ncbi:MAG: hypothetical protein H6610_07280 [Ignavibacteriales bacterium]|nr:hypothetical protein [Ignavibacteriales bacterium]
MEVSNSGGGNLNDLWKYNTNTDLWTWINGSNAVDQPGIYGTKGVSSSNIPGGRYGAMGWYDDNNNNFWLFGGWGNVTSSASDFYLNGLWQYDISNDQWTWVKG